MMETLRDHPRPVCDKPRPGPGYWDWRCLTCDQLVDRHPNRLRLVLQHHRVTLRYVMAAMAGGAVVAAVCQAVR